MAKKVSVPIQVPAFKRCGWWQGINVNGTAHKTVGFDPPLLYGQGDPSAVPPIPTSEPVNDADGHWIKFNASPVAPTNYGGLNSPDNQTQHSLSPIARFLVKTAADISSQRLVVGLTNGDPAGQDLAPTRHCVVIRYSTSAGDNTFKVLTNNGGAAATVTDTGIVVEANKAYEIEIDSSQFPSKVIVTINDDKTVVNSTLPSGTEKQGLWAKMQNLHTTEVRSILISNYYLETA